MRVEPSRPDALAFRRVSRILLAAWLVGIALWTAAPKAGAAQRLAAAERRQPAPVFAVREHRNLPYREQEPGELLAVHSLLDLYVPQGADGFPVLMIVHGGAWVSGDKTFDNIPEVARGFARQGIGVAAVNYRLSPLVRHPVHVQDVARALAWTHRNIAEYGGRPDQVFLFGHSAGGHLVSLLTTDESYLKEVGLSREDVPGVVSVSGVYRISDVLVDLQIGGGTRRLALPLAAGPYALAFGKDPELARQASPVTHVCEDLPPFLLLYAADELPTLAEMAEEFDSLLRESQCNVQLVKVEQRNHVTILWRARTPDDPVVRAVADFVREHTAPAEE